MNLHSKSQAEGLDNDGQILDKDGPGFKGLPCGDRGEAGRGTPREQAGPGREESVLVCYPINHRFHGEKHVNEEEGEQKCRQKFHLLRKRRTHISAPLLTSSTEIKIAFGQSGCHLWVMAIRTSFTQVR